jgi:hypothetical protein
MRRAAKRAKKHAETGHVRATSTIRAHVQVAAPLATSINSSDLPAALDAYAAKVEGKAEKRGSKVPRTLASLLGMGFQLIKWDGLCIVFLSLTCVCIQI